MILKIATGISELDRDEFKQTTNDDFLVKPRIADLVTDKMAIIEWEHYKLTQKGKNVARIFTIYRRLLGEGKSEKCLHNSLYVIARSIATWRSLEISMG